MKGTKTESEQGLDVDQDFLDRVLNKLYDFGDGPDDKRSKKTHKKRKWMKQEEEEDDGTVQEEKTDKIGYKEDRSRTAEAVSSERISASTSAVEVVTFQDPMKKKKVKQAVEPERTPDEAKEEKKKKKEPDVLSMEKARLDVHRFGITGFQKQQQRVFEQDRAIMLGARPPKKDCVNYKVYQQMIKEKKSKETEDEDKLDAQKKKRKSSGKQKNVKRKSGSSGGEPTGHVGRFKNGMLVLSSKDIQKLNRKTRK